MQSFDQTFAYVQALTQANPDTAVIDWRCIHDTDKGMAAHNYRGALPEVWQTLVDYNNRGWGIFCNINVMDGVGRELTNVQSIRTHVVDFDNINAMQNFERAGQWQPSPCFAVQTSPGKAHAYWQSMPYVGNERYTFIQRKLRMFFDGDKSVIDPTRVLRVPGFYHLKNPQQPHLVTCWALSGYGYAVDPAALEASLSHVNVVDGTGGRHDLGDATLQAPGLEWCRKALAMCDPNNLDRGEWISLTSAFKQAAWNWGNEQQLFDMWSEWCAKYSKNDPAENLKNWNSIRNTEIGWQTLEKRTGLLPVRIFSEKRAEREQQMHQLQQQQQAPAATQPAMPATTPMPDTTKPAPVPLQMFDGEFLSEIEQQVYFKDCVFIERMGAMLTPSGRFMNATQFNGTYGGKKFIIDGVGKTTNEPWQAATRSTLWTVPKADHIRFLPHATHGTIIEDALGRKGVNTYKPAIIRAVRGDVTPFLNHMAAIFPLEYDRKILFDYLAHNVKYPGFKIPWAPLIQSTEGAGKNALKLVMQASMGKLYTYEPKARELIDSGSKFNAWMRGKLFIIVDEIKTDERRDMIEILKPMISEEQIEIQGKGIDQDIEDNFSNWMFFSNWKDAIPVSKNSRRFGILYSALQSAADLQARGMNETYFAWFYGWLKGTNAGVSGAEHVADWLLNYQIERGAIPMRAPMTSSSLEAVAQSRGPVETVVLEAIEDALPGFRGGWVSNLAVAARLKGTSTRHVSDKTLGTIMEALGYHQMGRATRPYPPDYNSRATLWHWDRNAMVSDFGRAQGYPE